MTVNPDSKSLEPVEFKNLRQQLPMLDVIEANIEFKDMLPLIDSSDTNPDFWIRLAKMIGNEYDNYDGFVVLHGTDTMAYTASALSFLLENLAKPVILTGSQLPLGVIRTAGLECHFHCIRISKRETSNPRGLHLFPECTFPWQPYLQVRRFQIPRI